MADMKIVTGVMGEGRSVTGVVGEGRIVTGVVDQQKILTGVIAETRICSRLDSATKQWRYPAVKSGRYSANKNRRYPAALLSAVALILMVNIGAPVKATPATFAGSSASGPGLTASGYMARTLHHAVPGGVATVPLGASETAAVVHYEGKRVMVVKDSDGQWIGIVGIDLKAAPGRHAVQVAQAGATRHVEFEVAHKEYASQHIKLRNRAHVSPDPEQLKRYEREHAEQMKAYASFVQAGPSNVMLDAPVQGRTSSPFGLRRFFNGEERNPHSGLDFAVGRGTPIKAPADGVVTIVGDYFFNGRTVFLDHGQGFVTMYCHLDGIDVQLGQQVKRGDVLGRVGATGRATGPHLHWNVSLNGNRVDPVIFLRTGK